MTYDPQPIDTADVLLPPKVVELIEILAENTHNNWARNRLSEGWSYGPERSDTKRLHPCLVPYEALPDAEKSYDRTTVMETLKAIIALGYRIERAAES
jgi:ryanodine receptor 2